MPRPDRLDLDLGGEGVFRMNDWSFGQVCKLAGVSKETLNKLSPDTACRALTETLPSGTKPLQALTRDSVIRSIHGASYTRLHNLVLLTVVREFATDFKPPQTAIGGGTGLYCGEQDMFVLPRSTLRAGAEIEGEAFAPGSFLWNSEVGRPSRLNFRCSGSRPSVQNHIVWDAIEVTEFSRKHTAGVRDCITGVRQMIEALVEKRDQRRDGFARVMANAFKTKLGDKAEDVAKVLSKHGIPRDLAKQALGIAEKQGRFTVFSLVDALTRIAGQYEYVGERTEVDEKASRLLAQASAS